MATTGATAAHKAEAATSAEVAARRRPLQSVLPQPLLTLFLTGFWLLLMNDLSVGYVVFGLILGIVIPLFSRRMWPNPPLIRSYPKAAAYIALVLWDICVANIQVARIIVFRRPDSLTPRFVAIPTVLRSPEARVILAGTITMTPGTVAADFSDDGGHILVHVLDCQDGAALGAEIKQRYERRLMEIFE